MNIEPQANVAGETAQAEFALMPRPLFEAVAEYVSQRPFREVEGLVIALRQAVTFVRPNDIAPANSGE